jgi:hypothetical protein
MVIVVAHLHARILTAEGGHSIFKEWEESVCDLKTAFAKQLYAGTEVAKRPELWSA